MTDDRPWQLVLNTFRGGYTEGFDHSTEYEFLRDGWDAPKIFKLEDVHPAFNIWGLKFRPLNKEKTK